MNAASDREPAGQPRVALHHPAASRVRKLAVCELLGDAQELILVHDGHEYLLRITSNGKLLLTK